MKLRDIVVATGLLQPLAMFLKLWSRAQIAAGKDVQNHSTGTAMEMILSGPEACLKVIDLAGETLMKMRGEVAALADHEAQLQQDSEEKNDDETPAPEDTTVVITSTAPARNAAIPKGASSASSGSSDAKSGDDAGKPNAAESTGSTAAKTDDPAGTSKTLKA